MVSPKSTPLLSESVTETVLLTSNVGVATRVTIVESSRTAVDGSSEVSVTSFVPPGVLAVAMTLFST